MALTKQQELRLFVALIVVLAGLILYRFLGGPAPRTMPLVYTKGMSVSSPVRKGLQAGGQGQDALTVLLMRSMERYPGMSRDLFRMHASPSKPVHLARSQPVITVPTPTVPEKSPEEIAAEMARADLSSFRFLGYVKASDTDKDSSLFLSKDGELFIAKSGDTLLKNYMVKTAGKDYVVLYDRATKVEVRVDLTGSGEGRTR